jgi:hypothetical protein
LPASDRAWALWNNSSPAAAEPSAAVAPHLPLVADYRTGDFTLRHVFSQSRGETSSVRDWVVELIARYRFTIGKHTALPLLEMYSFAHMVRYNALSFRHGPVRPSLSRTRLVAETLFDRNPATLKALFARLEDHTNDDFQDIMMLCLNDDISLQHERTDKLLREWEARRWPRKAAWEL